MTTIEDIERELKGKFSSCWKSMMNDIDDMLPLETGGAVAFCNGSIDTDERFGYGYGISRDKAEEQCRMFMSHDGFIEANMSAIDELIEKSESARFLYVAPTYQKTDIIKDVYVDNPWNRKVCECVMTEGDRRRYIDKLKERRESRLKRLERYWKRYGSKVRACTFRMDFD